MGRCVSTGELRPLDQSDWTCHASECHSSLPMHAVAFRDSRICSFVKYSPTVRFNHRMNTLSPHDHPLVVTGMTPGRKIHPAPLRATPDQPTRVNAPRIAPGKSKTLLRAVRLSTRNPRGRSSKPPHSTFPLYFPSRTPSSASTASTTCFISSRLTTPFEISSRTTAARYSRSSSFSAWRLAISAAGPPGKTAISSSRPTASRRRWP